MWYLMRVLPYTVAPEVYSGVVATFVDITRLRETQMLFETVADTSPTLIWMSGTDKMCYWFNHPWLEFTRRTMEGESGEGWTRGVHREDYKRCLDTYMTAFDQRVSFSMEYRWLLDENRECIEKRTGG